VKKQWMKTGLVLALGMGSLPGSCWSQVVGRERDVTITGPRGRSIQRSFSTQRGPGFVDRQVTVQRPGGTFHSENFAQRVPRGPVPTGHRGGGFYGHRPGPRGPVFIERNVVIDRGPGWGPALAVGGGLFGLGMVAGSALASPPPPPVYVAQPAPVYVAPAPPPTVIYNPPQPYAVAPQPPATVVVDPVANAIGRLSSSHDNSRIEGAYTLGRLRDPRAVGPLADRLRNDWDKDVRTAAANALGEIGDPRASEPLRQAAALDKRQAVRDAANLALSRLATEVQAPASAPAAADPNPAPPLSLESPDPGPSASTSVPSRSPSPTSARFQAIEPAEDVPPPPPTPATSNSPGFTDTP